MSRVTVMTGPERRRRWRAVERERILAAAEAPGAIVADVARRWDISTSLIYRWRRAAQDEAPTCGFAPVLVDDEAISPAHEEADSTIAVELNGARITIGAGAPPALVVAALKALRR